ncbi:MAG TPA: peptidoglycan DD-metalloendopeptidase family protein [Actinomycetota bacterium]|nr:peptidoglycan DD-metalloendopeptidase family protein [Actinomycetota bacterium]
MLILAAAVSMLVPLLPVIAVPAVAAGGASSDQSQLDATQQAIATIQKKLAASKGQANVIQNQVNALNTQIDALNRQVGVNTQSVFNLKAEIDTSTTQIAQLQAQYSAAQSQANAQAVSLYEAGPANSLTSLLSSRSISEFIQRTQIFQIASNLESQTMVQTSRLRDALSVQQQGLATNQAELLAKEGSLADRATLLNSAKADRTAALDAVQATIAQEIKDEQELTATSEALTAALQSDSAISRGPANVNPTGLIWPVSGPITSPFGPRWGGFHYGIDIGARTGTPIHAAKSGTVLTLSCGSGYGICTIIDNGGGIETLYAHQSHKIIQSGPVTQGETIGLVGCTGDCTGPHLHFEVRVDGVPHNPISYLPGR